MKENIKISKTKKLWIYLLYKPNTPGHTCKGFCNLLQRCFNEIVVHIHTNILLSNKEAWALWTSAPLRLSLPTLTFQWNWWIKRYTYSCAMFCYYIMHECSAQNKTIAPWHVRLRETWQNVGRNNLRATGQKQLNAIFWWRHTQSNKIPKEVQIPSIPSPKNGLINRYRGKRSLENFSLLNLLLIDSRKGGGAMFFSYIPPGD